MKRKLIPAIGEDPEQPGLGALHPVAVDGQGGVEQDLKQEPVELGEHEPGGVAARLVVLQTQQGRNVGARTVVARGER